MPATVSIHRVAAALPAAVLAVALVCAPGPTPAQPAERTYEEQILRLAEILGAIHHLREICGTNEGQLWRDRMLALLEAEAPPGQLRGRLIAAFNNGFQGYQRTYGACTTTAKTATDRFFTEGSQIASALALGLEAAATSDADAAGGDQAQAAP